MSLNESKFSLYPFLCNTNTVLDSLFPECFSKEIFVKHLGVYMDKSSRLDRFVAYIIGRLKSFCGVVSKLNHYCTKEVRLLFYNSLFRSILDYGILVYGITSITMGEPIQKLQKRLFRLIFSSKVER